MWGRRLGPARAERRNERLRGARSLVIGRSEILFLEPQVTSFLTHSRRTRMWKHGVETRGGWSGLPILAALLDATFMMARRRRGVFQIHRDAAKSRNRPRSPHGREQGGRSDARRICPPRESAPTGRRTSKRRSRIARPSA